MGVRSLDELVEQVETVDVREFHIQEEASRYIWFRICVVLRRGAKRNDVQVIGRQQVRQRFADPTVIVHDKNDMIRGNHASEDEPLTDRSPSDTNTKVSSIPSSNRFHATRLVSCAQGEQHETSR